MGLPRTKVGFKKLIHVAPIRACVRAPIECNTYVRAPIECNTYVRAPIECQLSACMCKVRFQAYASPAQPFRDVIPVSAHRGHAHTRYIRTKQAAASRTTACSSWRSTQHVSMQVERGIRHRGGTHINQNGWHLLTSREHMRPPSDVCWPPSEKHMEHTPLVTKPRVHVRAREGRVHAWA